MCNEVDPVLCVNELWTGRHFFSKSPGKKVPSLFILKSCIYGAQLSCNCTLVYQGKK